MNYPFKPEPQTAAKPIGHDWSHAQSVTDWTVRIYGGDNPRTGRPQDPMEFLFHRKLRVSGPGYSRLGILYRANDYARYQHRTHFAVRDVCGSVIYDGPVLNELEAPRVFEVAA